MGAAERNNQVRWLNLTNILVAWVITVPVTATLAAVLYPLLRIVLGP